MSNEEIKNNDDPECIFIETTPDNYQDTNQQHGTYKIGQIKQLWFCCLSYNPCRIGANFLHVLGDTCSLQNSYIFFVHQNPLAPETVALVLYAHVASFGSNRAYSSG